MKYRTRNIKGFKIVELNRRRAIRERCLNCSGWIPAEVKHCAFTGCSLYPYRMGKGKQNATNRSKGIRFHCLGCTNEQPKEVRLCQSTNCSLYPYRRTVTDKSYEIKSLPKKAHIEQNFQQKIEMEYYTVN